MSLFDDMSKELAGENLQQIQECSMQIENITQNIVQVADPEDKADLILAVEDLLMEATNLYKKVYPMVWNTAFSEEIPEEER